MSQSELLALIFLIERAKPELNKRISITLEKRKNDYYVIRKPLTE